MPNRIVRVELRLRDDQLLWLKEEADRWNDIYGEVYKFKWRDVLCGLCQATINDRIKEAVAAIMLVLSCFTFVQADIFRWDNQELIPGTEGVTLQPGVDLRFKDLYRADLAASDLTGANFTGVRVEETRFDGVTIREATLRNTPYFTKEQLYTTASYSAHDLRGIDFLPADQRGWDLSNQDLTGSQLGYVEGTNLENAILVDASLGAWDAGKGPNLTNAVIRGARFGTLRPNDLYQTKSYADKDLRGITLGLNWSLQNADLAGIDFSGATLRATPCEPNVSRGFMGADLTGANLTGVSFENVCTTGAIFSGAIGYVPPGFTRTPGDSTADGKFDSSDLVWVFTSGLYEDGIAGNSTFDTGDWNGDGDFDSGDLVTAFSIGAYEPQAAVAAVGVPEPIGLISWLTLPIYALFAIRVTTRRKATHSHSVSPHVPSMRQQRNV